MQEQELTHWSASPRMRANRVTDFGSVRHLTAGAVRTAEHVPFHLHTVPEDAALTVLAYRGELVRRALQGIEHVRLAAHRADLERHPIIVAADFAYGHRGSPSVRRCQMSLRLLP
jgi:hypothetical protein